MPVLIALLVWVLVIGVIGGLVLVARRGSPVETPPGTFTFRHGPLLKAFAVVALVGGLTVFGVWTVRYPPQTRAMAVLLAIGAGVLLAAGGLLVREAFRFELVANDAELDCRSPWKKRRVVPWAAVERVSFSAANAWFVLDFADGGSFRVSAVLPGVGRFLELCEKGVPAAKLAGARRGYAWAGRKWPY